MNNLSPILNFLNKSIRASGKKIIRDFGEIEKLQGSLKKTENFIKIAKTNLFDEVCSVLKKIRPNLDIQNSNSQKEDCWILESIDSEVNFSRGNENFFIAVSLKENNKIIASVFYNPIKDENFYFQSGIGGYKNDYRIRVSETKKIEDSIFSFFGQPKQFIENQILGEIRNILKKKNIETRESGSIIFDLCMLVSGKIDCLIYSSKNKNQKEISTSILSETGGFIKEIIYKEKIIYIASNKYIGKIMQEMIENKYEFQ